MTTTPLKLYQVGTFAAGNRLLDPERRTVQARSGRSNSLTSGHRACQGCGEALGARYVLDAAMRATDGNLVAVNSTGCLEVFSTPYPESSWQLPWLHSLFGNGPAVAAGVAAARVGTSCQDVDAAARRVIDDAGYGEWFVHRTGHGIGVEEHEDPYIVAGNAEVLAPGHAFSIEPGIYVPGRWGARLEDIVVATDEGPSPVNHVDHSLVRVEG